MSQVGPTRGQRCRVLSAAPLPGVPVQLCWSACAEARARAQVAFLTLVFGGCQQYLAPSLASAHAHLIREQGLTVEHFDMVLEHLGDALEELDAALHELAEPSVRP